ncbi:hypothetical protein POJ06DRAFT_269745 [Lipomyces tetrasporus]|uniref:Globin domain-containing protein n=1 Tax=Lipomyces tetrasporus TaxID=54092 RepID=A0AAD7VR79_9ASCO|nr:uncharacterized protein POJ06DRAFT_269745 [Lipomyces tetrasporus]KAJ8098651.1 hypothetical protein POJ06DRAFT_269745 [Lipomyces tetrasporus]
MPGLFRKSKQKGSKMEPAVAPKAQPAQHVRQASVSTVRPPHGEAVPTSPSTSTYTRSSSSTITSSVSDTSTTLSSVTSPLHSGLKFEDIKINLTPEDVAAVKESWKETIGLSPANSIPSSSGSPASLFYFQFYQNLFAVRPDLEYMFPDVSRQSGAISGLFQATLAMLDNVDALNEILLRMGRRHAYVMGIEPEHVSSRVAKSIKPIEQRTEFGCLNFNANVTFLQYELVGTVFMQTLRDRLGERFTPQIEMTWAKIYSFLASKMIAAGSDDM